LQIVGRTDEPGQKKASLRSESTLLASLN
jgi:hypothetical protein